LKPARAAYFRFGYSHHDLVLYPAAPSSPCPFA
jgi:hypothetical protein